ncbi:MAG TPA: cytochrome P460 family protein [Polyangiaceae bacterium]|nr:cytochrome P460 family protein [Polyangiaceae bacterium]
MTDKFNARTVRPSHSLGVLLAATGLAALFACGTSDDNDAADTAKEPDDSTVVEPLAPVPGGPTPNGLAVPPGVQDWGVIGAAAVPGNGGGGTLRVIVGNEIAVDAARAGETNPWPNGTMLSHLQWTPEINPDDANTVGPGDFKALTLMVKDVEKYAADGGWAYGVWMGPQLMPPAAGFDRACVNCHTAEVQDKDYVFTVPGQIPGEAAFGAATPTTNGLNFPSQILDWKVIGIADIINPAENQQTLRVIVGNPTAVAAARSGNTNPWPDGSMISHFNWTAGTNPEPSMAGTVVPGPFRAFTLMQRSSALYAADGNWAYGLWTTDALTPPAAPTPPAAAFDRACVACHTSTVSERDMVFSRMAEFPDSMVP